MNIKNGLRKIEVETTLVSDSIIFLFARDIDLILFTPISFLYRIQSTEIEGF